MADFVTEETTIDAPVDEVLDVLLDFERYPEWARDIKSVQVIDRDGDGRPGRVRFRAAAMGRSTSYTLQYQHSEPGRLAWELIEGDITRRLDGSYRLTAADDRRTLVHYELEVELMLPLPGFVKRRSQAKIMHTALRELKARVEGRAR